MDNENFDNEFLTRYKNKYLNEKIPVKAQEDTWKNINRYISLEKGSSYSYFRWSNLVIGLVIPIIMFGALVTYAQGAQPGEPLYQIKILSDKFVGKITKNPSLPVEKRADDVINAVKENDTKKLDAAAQEYHDLLEETKIQANDQALINKTTGTNGKLKQTLKNQQEKLKKVQPQAASQNKPKIDNAIKETENTEKDIKGVSTEKKDNNTNSNNGNNNNNSRGRN